jgi:putative transposase
MDRQPYSTDLTDAQGALVEPHFPPVDRADGGKGRRRQYSYREILNGIFYILRAGSAWHLMPHDLPPWLTCYHYFNLWSRNGKWKQLSAALWEAEPASGSRSKLPSVKPTVCGSDANPRLLPPSWTARA